MARGRVIVASGILLTLVSVGGAACGDGGSDEDGSAAPASTKGFKTLTRSALQPDDAVPAPTGAAVLTISGTGVKTNTPEGLAFDVAGLESLGMVQASIYEPFEKKRIQFSGVELERVLEMAGVTGTATLHMVALDDYQVDVTAAEVAAGGMLLATKADGEALAIAKGGPARLVFLDGTKSGADTRRWIWSVARIEVR